jgi:hypothetical protein
MELGAFSVSLAVKDLAGSRAFYEALGFEAFHGEATQGWLILRNGAATIGLQPDPARPARLTQVRPPRFGRRVAGSPGRRCPRWRTCRCFDHHRTCRRRTADAQGCALGKPATGRGRIPAPLSQHPHSDRTGVRLFDVRRSISRVACAGCRTEGRSGAMAGGGEAALAALRERREPGVSVQRARAGALTARRIVAPNRLVAVGS